MPFDLPEVPKKVRPPADDMVLLGHMAAAGVKKPTAKVLKQPIPREARVGFIVALGVACFVLLLALVRAHS
jgi:hypothetical protein